MTKREVLNGIYAIISTPNNAGSPLEWYNEETRRYQEAEQLARNNGYVNGAFYQLWDMAVKRRAVANGLGIR